MIETHMRHKAQPIFNFLGKFFIKNKVTPNHITCAAFFFGALAGICIAYNCLTAAFLFLMLSGLCDIMDGTVARLSNCSAQFGAYMDLVADRMVEVFIIVGFTISYPQHYLAYIIFLGAVMLHFSTFVVAGSLFPNMGKKSMHYDASIVERAEAFIIFFAMLIFPDYIFYLLMLLNITIIAAGITRFARVRHYALKYIK